MTVPTVERRRPTKTEKGGATAILLVFAFGALVWALAAVTIWRLVA